MASQLASRRTTGPFVQSGLWRRRLLQVQARLASPFVAVFVFAIWLQLCNPADAFAALARVCPPDCVLMAGSLLFVAGITNGISGMGLAQVAAAGLAFLFGPITATSLLALMAPIAAIGQIVRHREEAWKFRRVLPLCMAAGLSVPIGMVLVWQVPVWVLSFLLGACTIVFVITSVHRVRFRVRQQQELIGGPLVGLVAGVCNGALGLSGPILGSYLLGLDLSPPAFVFIISSLFCVMSSLRLVGLIMLGQINPGLLTLGLGLVLPAIAGQEVGYCVRNRIPARAFQCAVLAMLLLAGIGLLAQVASANSLEW